VRALILAGGDRPDPTLLDAHWPGWRDAALVIAADGGARHATPLGLRLHQVIGDFDSLSAADIDELEAAGVTVTRFPTNKDATDTELALLAALDAGAAEITLLCTWGGRSDHAIGTLALLAHPRCGAATVAILDGQTRTQLLRSGAELTLRGAVGRIISITPWVVTRSSLPLVCVGLLTPPSSLRGVRAAFQMWQPLQSQSSRCMTVPCW